MISLPIYLLYRQQELAVRAMVLHGEQLHRVPLGGRLRLHPHGALHRPLHRHRLPAQAQNVQGQSYRQKLKTNQVKSNIGRDRKLGHS